MNHVVIFCLLFVGVLMLSGWARRRRVRLDREENDRRRARLERDASGINGL